MVVYSWQLALLVVGSASCRSPLALPRFQRWPWRAYTAGRRAHRGHARARVSEAVVGAPVIRASASERAPRSAWTRRWTRSGRRRSRAQKIVAFGFPVTELVASLAIAGVVLLGVRLGPRRRPSRPGGWWRSCS